MTGAIILAAGGSARLGTPKQTIMHNGKTLLQHAVDAATGAHCHPIVVVLGANAAIISASFNHTAAVVIYNNDWQQGMGSSIAIGMETLLQQKAVNAAIIMVCDQPYADANLLQTLIAQQAQTGKGIVASRYADTEGVPALFTKQYFDALLQLHEDTGAKKIMFDHQQDVVLVPFEKGIIDIDTMKDVENLATEDSASGLS